LVRDENQDPSSNIFLSGSKLEDKEGGRSIWTRLEALKQKVVLRFLKSSGDENYGLGQVGKSTKPRGVNRGEGGEGISPRREPKRGRYVKYRTTGGGDKRYI